MATSPAANSVCGTWAEHCCWIPPTPEEREAARAASALGDESLNLVLGRCPYLRDDGANWRTKKLPRRWCCTLIETACKARGVTVLDATIKADVRATAAHKGVVKRIRDHLQPYTSTGLVLTWTDCLDWPGTRVCNCCAKTNTSAVG